MAKTSVYLNDKYRLMIQKIGNAYHSQGEPGILNHDGKVKISAVFQISLEESFNRLGLDWEELDRELEELSRQKAAEKKLG